MNDAAEEFRAKLSEELRAAFTARNQEAMRTLRSIMSVLDNASAVSQEAAARLAAVSIHEVPRKRLGKQEIVELLQAEIAERNKAADIYEQIGNAAQAAQLRDDVALIQHLATLLP